MRVNPVAKNAAMSVGDEKTVDRDRTSSVQLMGFELVCPSCGAALEWLNSEQVQCCRDGQVFQLQDGVWDFLARNRLAVFDQFIREYETVRAAEGRGILDPVFYRSLPWTDSTGRFTRDWRIRSRSFAAFLQRVVIPAEKQANRPLAIVDLGAGNGWLTYQLRKRGHAVAAVDILTNDFDGLGCHRYYEIEFLPLRAEFDRLPLADSQADIVLFNASLHYSFDYALTLTEALRVLRPDGYLVILDSPIYQDAQSGQLMLREREVQFSHRFGFASNALPSRGFLTHDVLRKLGAQVGVEWTKFEPYYGIRWALKPWIARLRRHREPARFILIVGRRASRTQPGPPRTEASMPHRWLNAKAVHWRYRLIDRARNRPPVLVDVSGAHLLILPDVFNPKLFRSGQILAEVIDGERVPRGAAVLDMGTGSGVGAVVAARRAGRVVAVDVNPEAVRCAKINALLNRVDDRVEVRSGDLFGPVSNERFDLVLFNPPFFRGHPVDLLDRAWRAPDVAERFALGLADHLTPGGHALLLLSSDGDAANFLDRLRDAGHQIKVLSERDLINEKLVLYSVAPKSRGSYADSL